jgi:uncharacterized protein YwbE
MQATHTEAPQTAAVPLIVPRAEHNISRANISEYALKVLYKLKQEGFAAHLVGGGVRDLLLGRRLEHPGGLLVAVLAGDAGEVAVLDVGHGLAGEGGLEIAQGDGFGLAHRFLLRGVTWR